MTPVDVLSEVFDYMDRVLRRGVRSAAWILAAAFLLGGVPAVAQDILLQDAQIIYSGAPAEQANVKLGSWGNGVCEESNKNTYGGTRSVKITPRGLYEGGRLDFPTPVDLTKQFNDRNAYLQLVALFGGVQTGYDSWAVGLAAPGATDMYGGTTPKGKLVRRVQVMLYFEARQAVECQVDLASYKLAEDGWMTVSIPFAYLKEKLSLPEYKLSRLVCTGDGTEPFYVGEIRAVRDTTPLRADAGEEKEVAKNYQIVFHAMAGTGASAVRYSWDFDKTDGLQSEATGELIYHVFRRPGTFLVTLTVSDVFGLKEPAGSTIKVKVNE